MDAFDDAFDVLGRQVQALSLGVHHMAFGAGVTAIGNGFAEFVLKSLAINTQLVRKGRCHQTRWNGKNANTNEADYHRHGSTQGRDGRNVTIAHTRQRDHGPIHRGRNTLKLVGLGVVLQLIPQARGQDHQQHHHESRSQQHPVLALNRFEQGVEGAGVACELEQTRQSKHPQEPQVKVFVQQHVQKEGRDGQ